MFEDCSDTSSDNDDRNDNNDNDHETNNKAIETSPWYSAIEKIKYLTEGTPVIVYLYYMRDVEHGVEVLR